VPPRRRRPAPALPGTPAPPVALPLTAALSTLAGSGRQVHRAATPGCARRALAALTRSSTNRGCRDCYVRDELTPGLSRAAQALLADTGRGCGWSSSLPATRAAPLESLSAVRTRDRGTVRRKQCQQTRRLLPGCVSSSQQSRQPNAQIELCRLILTTTEPATLSGRRHTPYQPLGVCTASSAAYTRSRDLVQTAMCRPAAGSQQHATLRDSPIEHQQERPWSPYCFAAPLSRHQTISSGGHTAPRQLALYKSTAKHAQ